MTTPLVYQLIAISLYLFCMGFCFCDGFKIKTGAKILWFGVFALLSIYSLKVKGEFDLAAILPIPSLLAMLLGSYAIRSAARRQAREIQTRLSRQP